MPASRPFALLITWTTYGTWLPGDRRGYVSNTRRALGWEPKENAPQTSYRADDAYTRHCAQELQQGPTVRLTATQARSAAEALLESTTRRGWRIERAAVMTDHVHVVLSECPPDGSVCRRVLKGVSQQALGRLAGRLQRWWTAGGSDRYLNDVTSIDAAIAYVANQRGILAEIVDGRVVTPTRKPPG
jgi:REP element-mobilizing transposase RayT